MAATAEQHGVGKARLSAHVPLATGAIQSHSNGVGHTTGPRIKGGGRRTSRKYQLLCTSALRCVASGAQLGGC